MKIYVDFDDILSEAALYFSHLVKKMFGKDVPYENMMSGNYGQRHEGNLSFTGSL